jgi:dimethylargininase
VRRLPAGADEPDAVFIEDTAVVLDEIAILARPGAPSRRSEVEPVARALAPLRPLARIEPPATLDGGDVLVVGRLVLVGRSARTDDLAAAQLARHLAPWGYEVRQVAVTGCLHLKSAVTQVGDDVLLLNPEWIDPSALPRGDHIPVDPAEPFGANALRVADTVLAPASAPRTRERLERRGVRVRPVDNAELAKAEGGLTCCSLIVPATRR